MTSSSRIQLIHGDCLEIMRGMNDASVDMVFGSPPYEDARTYGIDFSRAGEDWVAWMVEVVTAAVRVSRGLVAMVVEGRTRRYRYSATPALLMADLHRAGIQLRKPPIYRRYGIPGSGGPDWLRNDWEWIVCAARHGKLPWSDNTANGRPPKYGIGGSLSYRHKDGQRHNRVSHDARKRSKSRTKRDGTMRSKLYNLPSLANPGNVITCKVGGGHLGSPLAHENEAPFPQKLAEFFVRSFCPPGGTVLDPFIGSGTTAAAAIALGRKAIGIDIRQSQIELAQSRLDQIQTELIS